MKKAGKQLSPVLRAILLVLTAALLWLCVSFLFPNKAAGQGRSEKDILREILYAYYWNQDLSAKRMETLLTELEGANEDSAGRWRDILACWNEATTDMKLHMGSLPSGLGSGGKLCLIVLGYQLGPDGSMQEELVGRLETALKSAKKYPDCYILCTGGGTAPGNPEVTEAGVMAQWLTEQGIKQERIILEDRSLTTSENAIFSYQILTRDHPEITQAAIISSDYHIPWGFLLFQAQFRLGEHPLDLVSNAAYSTDKKIPANTLLRYQKRGLMDIAGIS